MFLNRMTAIGVACVLYSHAAADVSYTTQDRYIQVSLPPDVQRRDANGFLPFNDSLDVQNPASRAISRQNSALGPSVITASLYSESRSLFLDGRAFSDCRLLVEFDVAQSTPFVLNGLFSTSSSSMSQSSFAHFALTASGGDSVFAFIAQPNDYFDFRDGNAIAGILLPGHYILDADFQTGASSGNNFKLATLDFTLSVPGPNAVLLSSLLLSTRRRRPEAR